MNPPTSRLWWISLIAHALLASLVLAFHESAPASTLSTTVSLKTTTSTTTTISAPLGSNSIPRIQRQQRPKLDQQDQQPLHRPTPASAASLFDDLPSDSFPPTPTGTSSSAEGEDPSRGQGHGRAQGQGGSSRASGMSVSAVALVAAIGGLVIVMPPL